MAPSSWSLSIFVTLSFVSITLASYGLEPATVHPSRLDTCFNKDTSSFYEDGDSWQISGCGMSSCMKISQPSGKYQMMISHEGCGSVGYEPPCYIEENKKADFPDCCPEVVCPDSSEIKSDISNEYNSNNLNNELDSGPRNETVIKAQKPESFVEKNPSSSYNDIYEKESQNKERQWRNVNNIGVDNGWVGSDEPVSNTDFQNNNFMTEEDESLQEDDLFSRKVSPKFWYWF